MAFLTRLSHGMSKPTPWTEKEEGRLRKIPGELGWEIAEGPAERLAGKASAPNTEDFGRAAGRQAAGLA